MKAVGIGGQLALLDDAVVISRKGVMGFLTQGLKGDKEIRLDSISSVQFKDAGVFMNGYIQFAFVGGQENKGGIFDATSDENSIMFTKAQQPAFLEIRDEIKVRTGNIRKQMTGSTISSADELTKFAKLRDEGVLSEDEFQAKKRQILGL